MIVCQLLRRLQRRGVRLGVLNGALVAHPSHLLSTELREAIKQHKKILTVYFSPCKHCGSKLIVVMYPNWYQVFCPTKPMHFLDEVHEDNLGKTLECKHNKAV